MVTVCKHLFPLVVTLGTFFKGRVSLVDREKAFSINIRRLRDGLRLSQAELALAAGVSHGVVFRAESKNTIPRGDNIAKLAAALGVDEAELFSIPQPTQNAPLEKPSKNDLLVRLFNRLSPLDELQLSNLSLIIEQELSGEIDKLQTKKGEDL